MSSVPTPPTESRDRAFALVARDVLSLYDQRHFAEALEVATAAVDPYPEYASRTSWFRACLLCRLGKLDEGMQVLRDGIERGDWWSEEMLRSDGDLSQLQWEDGFEELVARSAILAKEANEKSEPELRVLEPEAAQGAAGGAEPLPLLIALHGAGGFPGAGECWELACDDGWLVALPRSSRLISTDAPVWDDLGQARSEMKQHLADLKSRYRIDGRRIVLAGFSQGAGIAVELGVEGTLGATGVLAVAPWFDDLERLMSSVGQARPPIYLSMGLNDRGLNGTRRAYAALQEAGFNCQLEEHEGIGHEFPPGGKAWLDSALAEVGEPA